MGRLFQQEITQPARLQQCISACLQETFMPRVSPQFPQRCPFLLAPLSRGATEGKPHAGIHQTLLENRNRFYSLQETSLFLHGLPPTILLPASCLDHALLALSICCFATVYIFASHIYRCSTAKCKQITYGLPGSACTPSFFSCHCTLYRVEGTWIRWTWNAQNKGIKWLFGWYTAFKKLLIIPKMSRHMGRKQSHKLEYGS